MFKKKFMSRRTLVALFVASTCLFVFTGCQEIVTPEDTGDRPELNGIWEMSECQGEAQSPKFAEYMKAQLDFGYKELTIRINGYQEATDGKCLEATHSYSLVLYGGYEIPPAAPPGEKVPSELRLQRIMAYNSARTLLTPKSQGFVELLSQLGCGQFEVGGTYEFSHHTCKSIGIIFPKYPYQIVTDLDVNGNRSSITLSQLPTHLANTTNSTRSQTFHKLGIQQ